MSILQYLIFVLLGSLTRHLKYFKIFTVNKVKNLKYKERSRVRPIFKFSSLIYEQNFKEFKFLVQDPSKTKHKDW